jgi:DNA repair photolyase
MKVQEIECKSALTKSGIPGCDYCVNPYRGCAHGCSYCYASFMQRFTGHTERWGAFVDVKTNVHLALRRQLKRAKRGSVFVSSVTDPYQPLEAKYQLTRKCLEALCDYQFPVTILTRSPLCARDIDLFRRFKEIEVGMSIGTDSEKIKQMFEPCSPPIARRIACLKELHSAGISTYAFIGPMLPLHPDRLLNSLNGAIDEVLIDRLNYSGKVHAVYAQHQLEKYLTDAYFQKAGDELEQGFQSQGVTVRRCD